MLFKAKSCLSYDEFLSTKEHTNGDTHITNCNSSVYCLAVLDVFNLTKLDEAILSTLEYRIREGVNNREGGLEMFRHSNNRGVRTIEGVFGEIEKSRFLS